MMRQYDGLVFNAHRAAILPSLHVHLRIAGIAGVPHGRSAQPPILTFRWSRPS